jgi:hypothetical protein
VAVVSFSRSTLILFSEVRFKNNGLDLIEIQDNGSGISPENYENIGASPLERAVQC